MTDDSMSKRSLSALYREGLRRDAAGADAGDLLALDGVGPPDADVVERLSRTPDAVAVHGIARAVRPWSTALASDIRSVGSPRHVVTSRARNWGWISLAAAAGLAVCVVGLRQREASDLPVHAAAQPAAGTLQGAVEEDILFSDPDNALVAAIPMRPADSIFTDNLDG